MQVVPARTFADVNTVNYNPTVLSAMCANHEIELVANHPARLEHYMTKGSGGRDALMRDAYELQRRGGRADRLAAARLEREADLGRKQTTLTEALYNGILEPRLHPIRKVGLLDPVLVSTHLDSGNRPIITLLKLKYAQRSPELEHLTFAQFVAWYESRGATRQASVRPPPFQVPVLSSSNPGASQLQHLPPLFVSQDYPDAPLLNRPRPLRFTRDDSYARIVAFKVCYTISLYSVLFILPQNWRDEALELRAYRCGGEAANVLADSLRVVEADLAKQFSRAYANE